MKMLRYSFGLLATALIFLSSCRDFVEPNVPYKDFDTGAYLRTIARTSTSMNFFDLANSRFALTIEAVDKEDGKTVQTVEVRVRHRRLIPGVGLRYTPANDVLVRTLQLSDFKPIHHLQECNANLHLGSIFCDVHGLLQFELSYRPLCPQLQW